MGLEIGNASRMMGGPYCSAWLESRVWQDRGSLRQGQRKSEARRAIMRCLPGRILIGHRLVFPA